jgi:hypothetical protein
MVCGTLFSGGLRISPWESKSYENPANAHTRSDIFRLENLSVWQIPVFLYGLLMRNRGYIEFDTLEKQCWAYLGNKATNYFFYKRFAHVSTHTVFLIGKIYLNIGI